MQSERSEERDLNAPQIEDIDQLSNALFTHLNQQISQLKKQNQIKEAQIQSIATLLYKQKPNKRTMPHKKQAKPKHQVQNPLYQILKSKPKDYLQKTLPNKEENIQAQMPTVESPSEELFKQAENDVQREESDRRNSEGEQNQMQEANNNQMKEDSDNNMDVEEKKSEGSPNLHGSPNEEDREVSNEFLFKKQENKKDSNDDDDQADVE